MDLSDTFGVIETIDDFLFSELIFILSTIDEKIKYFCAIKSIYLIILFHLHKKTLFKTILWLHII